MVRLEKFLSSWLIACGTAVALAAFCGQVRADPPSPLQQLSDDTQRVYLQSRHSMVRVQLPTPQWLDQYNQRQQFLQKWGPKLDPMVREKLLEEQDRAMADLHHPSTSQPTTHEMMPTQLASATTQPLKSGVMADISRPATSLALYAVGLLVDDQGHAVFPIFVDRKYIGDVSLPASNGEGHLTTAKFVGSDAKTNLTVLQLADHTGVPAPLGHRRPDDGTLTLVISREGSARLVVWTNLRPEPGFAVLPDGSVAGFGFDNHFLGASTAKPTVDQLIATGEVHRAVLGVLTVEVNKDDILRRQRPELGNSPALRILAVRNNSAAAIGGIRPDDLVLAIGDEAVGDAPTFAAVIAARSGDTVLRVLRGPNTIELTVNLQPK